MKLYPKNVYIVKSENGLICGCFYNKQSAINYANGIYVHKLPVETHGIKMNIFQRILNYFTK